MINTIIGKKIDQTQKFLEDGRRIPVTQLSVVANSVVQIKTVATDGYESIQLGFGSKKKPTKATSGHSKKAGLEKTPRVLHEVRVQKADGEDFPQVGSLVSLSSVFKPGDIVAVTGTTKGKGFAGVVKRHGFRGGPKTHGQSDRHRAPGSIGQGTTPGRVYKGKRMAGHMGNETATVTNLVVVSVDEATQTMLVKGLVPGHKDGVLFITKTGEVKKFVELLEAREARIAKEAAEAERAAQETVIEEPKQEEAAVEKEEEVAEEAKEMVAPTTKEEPKEETADSAESVAEQTSEQKEVQAEEAEKKEEK